MTDDINATSPQPLRDHWGRYLIQGKPYTRATTVAESIDDRHNLEAWGKRMVAVGLAKRQDLYALAASIDLDSDNGRKDLDAIAEQALEAAGSSERSNLGTALHAFTEQLDAGAAVTAPEALQGDVEVYRRTLERKGLLVVPGMIERIVVLHDLQVAGTLDRMVTLDALGPMPRIGDLKTGRTLDFSWLAIAIQLSLYANADELYDPATETLTPMPAVSKREALVIHLPVGEARCDVYLLDIEAGWRAAQVAVEVRELRALGKRKQGGLVEPFTTTLEARSAHLRRRIELLRADHPDAFAQLARTWPAGVPTLKQGGHTPEHLTALARHLSLVEAEHSVPFGEADPADMRPSETVVVAMKGRADALPADLREELEQAAKGAGIPNLGSRTARQTHADALEPLLAAVELKHRDRQAFALDTVAAVCGDAIGSEAGALYALLGPVETWTAAQLDHLRAVRACLATETLYFVTEGDKVSLMVNDGEGFLVGLHGSKSEALAAVKLIAEQIGTTKPRSVSNAAANPLLVALAAAARGDITNG